jgi:hypothetical protein
MFNGGSMLPVLLMVSLLIGGCGWAAPGAGTEAVLIMKPWFFGHGGVDATAIKTGRTVVAVTTDVVMVDMRPTQYSLDFDDFMSNDGVPLDFHAVLRLQVTDSVKLIQQFGENWYNVNVAAEFSNRVRQAVRKHGMNETAIDTKAIDAIDAEVTLAMQQYFVDSSMPIKMVQMTVGKANPPDAIKNQRIETATQQQRQMTEQQRKLAEDQRKAAEVSRAVADNAYRNEMQLSPAQFLQLETIKMQWDVCASKSTCNLIIGGNAIPAIGLRQ